MWIAEKAIRIRRTLYMESGLITSRRVSFALMVCMIFGSIPTVLAEEETPTASRIVGTVVQSGQPVQGATVVARDLSSGVVSRSLPTNAAGKYVIHIKGLGYHDMAIETGNMVFPATRVLNVIGEETTANFQLLPSVNSKGEPRTFEVAHAFEHVRVVVASELVNRPAIDGDRVVEALVALDELFGGGGKPAVDPGFDDRMLQLGVVVDAIGARGARRVSGFEDDRVAHAFDESFDICNRGNPVRDRAGQTGLAQGFLHRRFVAAEKRAPHARARDPALLTHVRGGQDVGLDRRLEPVDPTHLLAASHGPKQRFFVDYRADLLVVVHVSLEFGIERLDGRFPDAGDARARGGQTANEFALVTGKGRFDKNNVHHETSTAARRLRHQFAVQLDVLLGTPAPRMIDRHRVPACLFEQFGAAVERQRLVERPS